MGVTILERGSIVKGFMVQEDFLNSYLVKENSPKYTQHDLLFKQLIRYFFKDFLEAFFPKIYNHIDLKSLSLISGEVFTDVIKGSTRKLDIVMQAKLKETEALIIVHVEPQSTVQRDFNERMFQYYSLLYNEYRKPIIPIAVFSYKENWDKNEFIISVLGEKYLYFKYRTLHLKKMNWRHFIRKDNPVVAALLSKMGYKEEERVQVKVEFMRMLGRLQLAEAEQRLIYGFFESYLKLNEKEEEKLVETIREFDDAEEILKIPISYEEKGKRKGLMEGRQQGIKQGIERGIEQGIKQGIEKGRKEVALELLKEGVPLELIVKTTKLSAEVVQKLKKQL